MKRSRDARLSAEAREAAKILAHQSKVFGPDRRQSLFQLANTLVPFFALLTLMMAPLELGFWIDLILAVPAAGLLVRLFIMQHDCGHGSFFKSRFANDAVGRTLGVLTLTPYGAWKRDHAAHHATNGNLDCRGHGDVTTVTVAEYDAMTVLRRLAYRLYRNPLIMVLLGAPINFIVLQRFAVGQSLKDREAWRSIVGLDLCLAAAFGLPMLVLGVGHVLAVYLPVIIVASWIGNWLFYVQHQFEGAYWQRKDAWNFQSAALHGGSYFKLPPVLQWFSGNIGLHHIHHLCSRIPNYRLQACLDGNPKLGLISKTITLRESLGCWRLALWDEQRGMLISFNDAKRRGS